MPGPMNPKLAAAYENIKKITGLEFDENNLEEVQKALGRIYVNGHDLFISGKFDGIRTNNDATVIAVSGYLTNLAEGSEKGFISLMNPNDPYAVPKVLYQNNESDEAGRAYERDFQKNHRKNIARLNKELEHETMPKSEFLTASNYFVPDQFNKRTGRFRRQSDIWEFSGTEQAVQLCNLILLGRGYKMEDLLTDYEEVAEAKRKVGAELTEIMYEGLSLAERSRRFRDLVKDSMDGLNELSFRPVDLGDDSTLENVRYNQWIANMTENLGHVLSGAKQTFNSQWIVDTEKKLDRIRNYTGGVAALDRARLKGVNGELRTAESMREPVLAQVLVEKAGMPYVRYHSTRLAIAANDVDLKKELTETLKDHIRGNDEYAEALRRGRKNVEYKDVFKQITERDLAREGNLPVQELEDNMKKAARTTQSDIRANGRVYAWFDSTPEHSAKEYGEELQKLFIAGKVTQLSRPYTIEALVMAYGLWKAEQNHEQVSIKDFYDNAELQKATGVEAIEYLRKHPIPGATEEQSWENARAFSELIAALNRKLADTELPKFDYRNPREMEANREYLHKLHVLLCDSHQLRDVVPDEMIDVFYEANGGRKAYVRAQNQISLAEALTASLDRQVPDRELQTRSLNSLFAPDKADGACRGLYILKHGGEEYLGKKIGTFPKDDTGRDMWATFFGANTFMKGEFTEKAVSMEYRKGIRDYLLSHGETDPVGIETTIENAQSMILEIDRAERKMESGAEQNPEDEPELEEAAGILNDTGSEDSMEQVAEPGREAAKPDQAAEGDLPRAAEEEVTVKDSYDWSRELSPTQWKERLEKFYQEIDDHDPSWLRSSEEFRDVKHNLKKALELFEDNTFSREAFNSRMEKLFRRAGDYIDKKKAGTVGKHYGKERLTTITELRELLAGRNKNPLDVKGVADLFGQRVIRSVKGEEKIVEDTASQQEKLERGMMRLGIYLASAEEDAPEKVKGKMELVERVIAERGKNPETRSRLMDEMAKIKPYGNTKELMEQAMERITGRMLAQNGLDRQSVGWGKVLKALETTAENSRNPAIRKAVSGPAVKNYLMLSNFAERAQKAQDKILDSENAKSLSREEAGAIVASAVISTVIKSKNDDAMTGFNCFIEGKSEEQLLEHFAAGAESQALQKLDTNESLRKGATGGMAQELIGISGMKKICQTMLHQIKAGQAHANEHQMQKSPMMGAH